MQAIYRDAAQTLVTATLVAGEVLNGEPGPGIWQLGPEASARFVAQARAGGVPVAPFPNPVVDLAAYIAAGHVALRDGGVTVGGMRIKTDDQSRGLIDGAYALSTAQPDKAIDFKAASGWATIDSQTMQTVALAVGQWVQACYSAYRKLDEGRAAGTVTTTAQVDAAFAAVTLPG